jgi:glycosyltransferase involved in cell wall biosynthesis
MTRKMQILQIVPHYVPAYRFGGPLRVAHSLGKALVRAGHDVIVCTTNLVDESHNLDVPTGIAVDVDGISVYYEPVKLFRHWGFSPALYRRIHQKADCADLVLIHAHFQFANLIGGLAARRRHKPYVVFAHSSLHRCAIAGKNRWLKYLYLLLLERNNLNEALFIAFNAEEEKAQSLYRERGVVIPSGVDADDFANLPAPGLFRSSYPELAEKQLFLFLGRLDVQQKGLDLLIPAFSQLVADRPEAHLVLAGPDENHGLEVLERTAAACGVGDHITLTGLITGELKKAALQDADVFVLPSRFEGLSIALLEALYSGLPVLVTNRVGLSETIRELDAGEVTEPSIDGVARGLLRLIDEEHRSAMRNRAIPLVRDEYTWDSIAQKLLVQVHRCRIDRKTALQETGT